MQFQPTLCILRWCDLNDTHYLQDSGFTALTSCPQAVRLEAVNGPLDPGTITAKMMVGTITRPPSPGHHHTAPASCPSAEFARELWRSVAWIGAAYAMCIGREGRAGTALGISRYLMAWRKAKPHHLDLKHKNNCMQNQNQNQNSAERCNAVHGIARHYMTLCDAARLFAALHVNA